MIPYRPIITTKHVFSVGTSPVLYVFFLDQTVKAEQSIEMDYVRAIYQDEGYLNKILAFFSNMVAFLDAQKKKKQTGGLQQCQ